MTNIGETKRFDVYLTRGTLVNGRVYWEHKDIGDEWCGLAVIQDSRVVDLDACPMIGKEIAAFLRAKGVDTNGAAVDD